MWKMLEFSHQFPIARENKTHRMTRTWNIGTYDFPKVWVPFFPSNSHLIQTKFVIVCYLYHDISNMQ